MRHILSPLVLATTLACGPAPPERPGVFDEPADVTPEVDPLREWLRDAHTGPALDPVDADLARFYGLRDHRPAFVDEGGPLPTAHDLVALLTDARSHGLRPAVYEASRLHHRVARPTADLEDLLTLEHELAGAALRFARHLATGRTPPIGAWGIAPDEPDLAGALHRAIEADDVAGLLSVAPSHPQYHALRDALARYRTHLTRGWPDVPRDRVLRPGDPFPIDALDALTARLHAEGFIPELPDAGGPAPPADAFVGPPPLYDEALADGVRRFQRSRGLTDDGVLGPSSWEALAVPVTAQVETIERSLDRWRWMPSNLGDDHVLVQIPAFQLQLVREGRVADEMAVIVGKPSTPTPVFADRIETVVLNPYWNVPASIARGDQVPKARANPGWLARNGYEAVDGQGRRVDPRAVSGAYGSAWRIRQRPGRGNALGSLKILFPNEHAVYLHDTNQRGLFARSARAFSHGCVRVERPHALAAALLGDRSEAELKGRSGRGEQWLPLDVEVPIYLVYLNAEAEPDGTVRFHPDPYGLDRAHADALQQEEPRYAEGPPGPDAG